MKKSVLQRLIVATLVSASPFTAQTNNLSKSTGVCSPAISGGQNTVSISCKGVSATKADELITVMNRVLREGIDTQALSVKIDLLSKETKVQTQLSQSLLTTSASANEIAKQQLFLTQRPQLVLRKIANPTADFHHGNIDFFFKSIIENVGKTPALNTLALYRWFFLTPGQSLFPQADEASSQVCHSVEDKGIWYGAMVPPDTTRTLEFAEFHSLDLIRRRLRATLPDPEGNRTVQGMLYGCLLYRSDLSPTPHHFGFSYYVRVVVTPDQFKKITEKVAFAPNETDFPSQLTLKISDEPQYGGFAN